mmetsp:Transcript_12605/g.18939  ORF Transcript_12605/g.18939 Transcript_12605/m.18939 type:complete len:88 (-) Transcript_12605:1223-1486(-)
MRRSTIPNLHSTKGADWNYQFTSSHHGPLIDTLMRSSGILMHIISLQATPPLRAKEEFFIIGEELGRYSGITGGRSSLVQLNLNYTF